MTAATLPTPSDERGLLLAAFARGVRPSPVVSPAEWGRDNFIVPVGPQKGQPLDLSLTPHLVEPLEMLRVDSPWTQIAAKKSGQSAFSTLGLVWLMCLIDTAPDDMMIVQPSLTAAKDFNSERLDPLIKSVRVIANKVRAQKSRDADGSKTLEKKFPGGRLVLTGANSSTDLSAKTIRYMLRDEVDRWPADLDGQGDPMELCDARQLAFTRSGTHKSLVISTPTNKGASRIDVAYAAGDQRKWFVRCPHCDAEITFEFSQLRGEPHPPFDAHYMAQCCGAQIDSWQQRDMVLRGVWKPTHLGPGRQPSYFFNSLSSLLTSWDEIWGKYLDSRDDPLKEKGFANLWLGESYEDVGSDLDPARIAVRIEDYQRDVIPPWVGRLVLAADTQDDRFEWALWGFGPASGGAAVEQTLIAAGEIAGDLHEDKPWDDLDALSKHPWPHAGGKAFVADVAMIDTGGHFTQRAYRFVHKKARWRGIKGSSDRAAMALSTPRRFEVKNALGRLLFRVPIYFVGTYDLKLWLSHALKCIESDKPLLGGLRLTKDIADEAYLEQMTAEVLAPRERRDGMVVKEWKKIRPRNEALDLAVYARAGAYGAHPNGLGVDRLSPARWAAILADRHGLIDAQSDLFAPEALAVATEAPPEATVRPTPTEPPAPPPASPTRKRFSDIAERFNPS
jgi:phage terminase large subunit GpA-like protein